MKPNKNILMLQKVAGLTEYAKIESALRKLGFKRPIEEQDQKIICRWDYRGILVDVMPTDEKILGFTNRWYSEAIRQKVAIMRLLKNQHGALFRTLLQRPTRPIKKPVTVFAVTGFFIGRANWICFGLRGRNPPSAGCARLRRAHAKVASCDF